MGDLISRKAVLDEIRKVECEPGYQHIGEDWAVGLCIAESIVEEAESTEPERKKGKWIYEKINSYTSRTYCSECGSSAPFVYESDDYYGNHAHGETAKTKFCPNCGADMRLQST